jgi:hypothetical protein
LLQDYSTAACSTASGIVASHLIRLGAFSCHPLIEYSRIGWGDCFELRNAGRLHDLSAASEVHLEGIASNHTPCCIGFYHDITFLLACISRLVCVRPVLGYTNSAPLFLQPLKIAAVFNPEDLYVRGPRASTDATSEIHTTSASNDIVTGGNSEATPRGANRVQDMVGGGGDGHETWIQVCFS